MKFYPEAFKKLRKKERFSIKEVCEKAKITRTTLWEWETGKRAPSEQNIRMLAKIINVPVNNISSLESPDHYSKGNFADVVDSWLKLSDLNNLPYQKKYSQLIDGINSLNTELTQATIVIRALLSSLDAIFYIKDSKLKYITASNSFLENIGLKHDFIVKGKNDSDFFPKKTAEENNKEDLNIMETGNPIIHKEDYIPGTRNKKWGLISKRPILDPKGKIAGLVAIFVDITDRKKNEHSREVLELAIQAMDDGFTIRPENKNDFMFINKGLEKTLGYPIEQLYEGGLNFLLSCIHPEDLNSINKKLNKEVSNKDNIRHAEYRIIKSNKETCWLSLNAYNRIVNNVLCNITTWRDITQKKETEEKIEKLLKIIDNVDEGIIVAKLINSQSIKIEYINSYAEDITALSKNEVITHSTIPLISLIFKKIYDDNSIERKKRERILKIENPKTNEVHEVEYSIYYDGLYVFSKLIINDKQQKINYREKLKIARKLEQENIDSDIIAKVLEIEKKSFKK